mmetsp:Transcript_8051/g.25213  ORF Transcript_8051/g.25213 Transcript_8051/m.25213 type:complete len:428 (-) Transcript_8051:491-1774(-)
MRLWICVAVQLKFCKTYHPISNATRGEIIRENVALAALVVNGHKAVDGQFIQTSACAALTMISSARTLGMFSGDAIVMMGPLGTNSPHDQASWRRAKPGWISQHNAHVQELVKFFNVKSMRIRAMDLVPLLLSNKYPFMKRNLNYMKLAVYTLGTYDKVMFIDLDIVIVGPLTPILALSNKTTELVGYRTCTAPVNSGFFIVRPKGANGRLRLRHLNDITLRNKCPCRSAKDPFASLGFDNWGAISMKLRQLWDSNAYDAPNRPTHKNICREVLSKTEQTWNLAGAGTGQGLMWYYFGLKIESYVSLTYADLPFVHYNAPGPKPWTADAQRAVSDPGKRQHCDFIWWSNFLEAKARYPGQNFGKCLRLLVPHLSKKRSAGHFIVPSCCRTCPGGGHFATAQPCAKSTALVNYAVENCHIAAELSGPL